MAKIEVKGNKMVIEVELGSGSPSASGKNITVDTTNGFLAAGEYRVSLNVIRKPKTAEEKTACEAAKTAKDTVTV